MALLRSKITTDLPRSASARAMQQPCKPPPRTATVMNLSISISPVRYHRRADQTTVARDGRSALQGADAFPVSLRDAMSSLIESTRRLLVGGIVLALLTAATT